MLPFSYANIVVSGDKLGRSIGFPTANLKMPSDIPVSDGVYTAEAILEDISYPAMAYLGVRPSLNGVKSRRFEVHILADQGFDLYGKELAVTLLAPLRPEMKFTSLEALKIQLQKDKDAALTFFALK